MDYTHLRTLLAVAEWRKADDATAEILLTLTDRAAEGWLDAESIARLRCDDLQAIDQLWRQASGGRFGLGVQAEAWEACGGRVDYPTELNLGEKLGWYNKDRGWLFGDKLNHSLSAPVGHLPNLGGAKRGVLLRWMSRADVTHCALSWRMAACSPAGAPERGQPPAQPDYQTQVSQSGTTLTVGVTDPRDLAESHYRTGCARLEQGQYPEAVTAFDQVLRLFPESAEALQAKAVALLRLEQRPAALQACEEALQRRPDFVEAWHLRAGVLMEQKRFGEAMESCERALRLNPNFTAASELREHLRSLI